ncbi:MAG: DUF4442 domain-containing protein [bacterium]|nr:DUF4442 domain-containing protein [bacterium]
MNKLLNAYNTCTKFPLGKTIFSKLVCLKAPYFGTIHPRFVELRHGYGEIKMKKRRSVQNHLRSVHAIAMGNLCELVAGTTLEATLPPTMRWIPSSMNIEYLKIARTNLKASCTIPQKEWNKKEELPLTISVTDTNNIEVVRAVITMHVSPKK